MKQRRWMALAVALIMLLGMLPAQAARSDTPFGTVHTHTWGSWRTLEPATCADYGLRERTCSVCGETEEEDIPINSSNHSWGSWTTTRAATCGAEGVRSRTCAWCGRTETQSIDATGDHSWGSWSVSKAATCTAGGEETRKCSVCGKSESRGTKATGHSWGKWKTTRAATCDKVGQEERKCSACGQKETREIKKTAHTYGEWTVEKEPTCTEKGRRTRVCQNCGNVDAQEIAMIPHTFGEWTVTLAATCTAEGAQTSTCQVCGYQENQTIPMIPHAFGEWTVITAATCTAEGAQAHTCQACGLEERQTLDRLPHAFGEWNVIAPLTDWSAGLRVRVCATCGLEEREEREPAGKLQRGDRGEDVRRLQNALNQAGYDSGTPDGVFGAKTESAVKKLEAQIGKPQDGIGWPGVTRVLTPEGEMREDMALECVIVTEQAIYPEGETAVFQLTLTNTSGKDLESWTIYQSSWSNYYAEDWVGIASGGFLAKGESVTIEDVRHTVNAQEAKGDGVDLWWYASGKGVGNGALYSNDAVYTLLTKIPAPIVGLWPDDDSTLVLQPFEAGDEIDVPMTLWVGAAAPVKLVHIGGNGGSVSDEEWMHADLTPGTDYHFTYTVKVEPGDIAEDWSYRTVSAEVLDPETEESGYGSVHLFLVQQVEGSSMRLIQEDTTGMAGMVDEALGVQMLLINNGTMDLGLENIRSEYATDLADLEGWEDYYTNFPAGASRWFDFYIHVLPSDVEAGEVVRNVKAKAHPLKHHLQLVADEEQVRFGVIGEEQGYSQLGLMISQVTPDQEYWTALPDGSIATLEFAGSVVNLGSEPMVIDGVHGYLYPDSEASIMMQDFTPDVLLEPGESYPISGLSVTLSKANIMPGSATELFDGIVNLCFIAFGKDPDTGEIVAMSETPEFNYKVKNGEYGWAEPPTGAPAIAISAEDTSGKGGAKGEGIPVSVTIRNSGETSLTNVTLNASAADGNLTVSDTWTLPAEQCALFEPGASFTISYSAIVTADDVGYAYAHGGRFNRWLIVTANDMATGQQVQDDVLFELELLESAPAALQPLEISKRVVGDENRVYTIDEEIVFEITVHNPNDVAMENVAVYDHINDALLGDTVVEGMTLAPNETRTFTWTYTVTFDDVANNGFVKNVARVWPGSESGGMPDVKSNEVYVSVGRVPPRESEAPEPTETLEPKPDDKWTPWEIDYLNPTEAPEFYPYMTREPKTTAEPVPPATYDPAPTETPEPETTAGLVPPVNDDPAPTETPEPETTAGLVPPVSEAPEPTETPEPETTAGLVPPVSEAPAPTETPEPETTVTTETPEPGTGAGDYCKRPLIGKGAGTAAFDLDYCAVHGPVADGIDALLAEAETAEAQLDAWQQAVARWTEAVNAEYDALLAKVAEVDRPTIVDARALFYLRLTCYQDALTQLWPEDPAKVAAKVSEQLMNHCVDLCYETHTAPGQRIDSFSQSGIMRLPAMLPGEDCQRTVTRTDYGAVYLESLCEAHRATEAAVDALLAEAKTDEALESAWRTAKQLWLAQLDELTNARYLAANAEGRAVIAADRVAFGNWLKARESFLKRLYPGKSAIVDEVIAQTIRARVIDFCGED